MVNCKTTVPVLCILALSASGQTPGPASSQVPQIERPGFRLASPYRARHVTAASFTNSARTYELIRAGNMYLSLQDAIALTLENNLDLQLQRYNPLIADTEVKRAKGGGVLRGLTYTIRELPQGVGGPGGPLLTTLGSSNTIGQLNANSADLAVINQQQTNLSVQSTIPYSDGSPIPAYDPLFSLGINGAHLSQPQNSFSSQGTTNLVQSQVTGSGGYQQSFSTGTSFALNYNASRYDANWLRSDYNPYSIGSLGFTITQPLLQGFGIDMNRRFIRIAGNEQKIANLVFNQQLINTVASVIRLYWDLVSLRADVTVRQQALATALKLYQNNKQQVDVGTLAPLQLKQAAAEVARAKQDLINAQSLVDQQEIVLKNVLTRSGSEDLSLENVHLIPLDHIEVPKQEEVPPPDQLILEALRNRPDLAQDQLQCGFGFKGFAKSIVAAARYCRLCHE
jgi:outer membrane protein